MIENGFFDMMLFGEVEDGLGATFKGVGDVFAGFGEDFQFAVDVFTFGSFAWSGETAEEFRTEREGAAFIDELRDDLIEFVGAVVAAGEAGHAETDDVAGFGDHSEQILGDV